MPLTPERKALYPSDWPEIRQRILARAGDRCECTGQCGLHRGRRCDEVNGRNAIFARGKIVLTIAHLDHDPRNSAPSNLKALCQRCHLRYDAKLHSSNASSTRDRKRGQLRLIDNRIDPTAPSKETP